MSVSFAFLHFSKSLGFGIFDPQAIVYCQELNELQQVGYRNINQGNFLALLKCTRKKIETEKNLKSDFEATRIWPIHMGHVVMSVFFSEEDVFMNSVGALV